MSAKLSKMKCKRLVLFGSYCVAPQLFIVFVSESFTPPPGIAYWQASSLYFPVENNGTFSARNH